MTDEALYRREGLTIGALARALGTQEYVLRRVINQHLGYRNFNDLLHSYRIREACARLRSPGEARRPVLSKRRRFRNRRDVVRFRRDSPKLTRALSRS